MVDCELCGCKIEGYINKLDDMKVCEDCYQVGSVDELYNCEVN